MRTILIFLLLVALGCQAEDTNQLIGFRYIKTGEFNNGGYLMPFGAIFWATNRTTNMLSVTLSAIEIKKETYWVSPLQSSRRLPFQPPGQPPSGMGCLNPHAAGYASIQLSNQPSGTIWRAKVLVAPILTGFEDKVARIKHYPDLMQRRWRTGNTKTRMNPFATNMFFYGTPIEVRSQEILEE
jgi:hypothetical protein